MLLEVFPFSKGVKTWEELKETERMKNHAASIMHSLDKVIQMTDLDNVHRVATILEPLGGRHFKYGIKTSYFKVRYHIHIVHLSESFRCPKHCFFFP